MKALIELSAYILILFYVAPLQAAADTAEAAAGHLLGKTMIRDTRQRFVLQAERLSDAPLRDALFIAGNFLGKTHAQLLLLDPASCAGEIILFENAGRTTWRLPLQLTERSVSPAKTCLRGRFTGSHDQLLRIGADGELRVLKYARTEAEPSKAERYRGYPAEWVQFSGSPWGKVAPGTQIVVGRLNDDAWDDLSFFSADRREIISAYSTGETFRFDRRDNPCRAFSKIMLFDIDGDSLDDLLCINGSEEPMAAFRWSESSGYSKLSIPADATGVPALPPLAARLHTGNNKQLVLLEPRGLVVLQHDSENASLERIASIEFTAPGDISEIQLLATPHQAQKVDDLAVFRRSSGTVEILGLAADGTLELRSSLDVPNAYASADLVAADFRGIEAEDLLLLSRESGRWAISNLAHYVPISSVRISSGLDYVTYSDAQATYQFPRLPVGEATITASLVGHQFLVAPPSFKVEPGKMTHVWAYAEIETARTGQGPMPCVGFNRDMLTWGYRPAEDYLPRCAYDDLIIGAEDGEGNYSFDCCPLPADDIFEDEWRLVYERCPEGFAAVAPNRATNIASTEVQPIKILCRKLNTKRYQFGPLRSGKYWGTGQSYRTEGRAGDRDDIPLAIRYGIGRESLRRFDPDGCIGDPPGSVLVAKQGKHCKDMLFREIQYAGMPGDPLQGASVKMYPDCTELSGPFSPNPHCARGGDEVSK